MVAAVGEGYCFLIDGLSYIAVIAGLLAMQLTPDERPPSDTHVWQELAEGWNYVVGVGADSLDPAVFLAVVGVSGTPYTVLMPMIAGRTLDGGAAHPGIPDGRVGRRRARLRGAPGAAHHRRGPRPADGDGRRRCSASACVLLGLSRWLWISMLLMALTGYGLMYQMVATNTIVQTIVDDDKRGRVMSFYTIALLGSAPIGSLLSGSLAARIGVPATFVASGVACALAALWFWRQLPAIRIAVRPDTSSWGSSPRRRTRPSRQRITREEQPPGKLLACTRRN